MIWVWVGLAAAFFVAGVIETVSGRSGGALYAMSVACSAQARIDRIERAW